ncbi:hypothetical protein [Xanthobacter autotrophicus]|uniref:hypothetical protein n=1 Tax=Xanthobacter autotrophicus TaxID=280 RepID=UPI00372735AD
MFLEKHSRFFRQYDLRFSPRNKRAALLPIDASDENYSVRDAIETHMKGEKALSVQPNGDIIELVDIKNDKNLDVVVLLFHRASPNAADPMYRKKALEDSGKKIKIRQIKKDDDEEQAVSSHLVISKKSISPGVYRSVLEEVPGISMSYIRPIIGQALNEYKYPLSEKDKAETYTTFAPEGVKSENLTQALKKGELHLVTLSRLAKPDAVDCEGYFEPTFEYMKLRVKSKVDGDNWKDVFYNLVKSAKGKGWEHFNVDIGLDDNRRRTVNIDRDDYAKEVLFVRSELVEFKSELVPCSDVVVNDIVAGGAKLLASRNG